MTLSASKLKTELESLGPTGSEATARARLAAAWTTYFYEAGVAGTPCAEGTLASAQAGMEGALVGMSTTGQGGGPDTGRGHSLLVAGCPPGSHSLARNACSVHPASWPVLALGGLAGRLWCEPGGGQGPICRRGSSGLGAAYRRWARGHGYDARCSTFTYSDSVRAPCEE